MQFFVSLVLSLFGMLTGLFDLSPQYGKIRPQGGRIVAHSLDSGTALSSLSRDTLTGFHPALDIDPATFFSAERSLEARALVGGPARKAVDAALREARHALETTGSELGPEGDVA